MLKVGGIIAYDNALWMRTVAAAEKSVPEVVRESGHYINELNKLLAARRLPRHSLLISDRDLE